MSRVRIYELAKEAGMASKVLAEKLIGLGYDIKGHSSTVDGETAAKIRSAVLQGSDSELVEKRIEIKKEGGPTVIRRRATTIIRRPKKEEPELESEETPEDSADENVAPIEEKEVVRNESPAADSAPEEKVVEEVVAEVEEKPAVDESKNSVLTVEELIAKKAIEEAAEAKKQKEDAAQAKADAKKAEAEKNAKKGIAKVIGSIELPKEEPKRPPR
ncbi:MAG: translation initiation factor IF-2, partial [Desulfocapsa sp.]